MATFPVSIFGIITNLIVVVIILRKKNRDIFKDFAQYSYLASISIFNIIILSIECLSWMSECNESFDFLCPVTHLFVPFQFFKIIFKETLIVSLRFMTNFAYIAFALNRISLIGKNHTKLVEFMSKVSLAKYLIVTSFISLGLSLVKLFRFQPNYDHSERGYPINFEENVWLSSSRIRDAYFVINSIIDLLNYVIFVIINIAIDIYMLVKLKRTLDEKLKKKSVYLVITKLILMKDIDEKKSNNKSSSKKEAEDPMNNAIKMVVLNSGLNILFKLPLAYIPIHNSIGTFYFKSQAYYGGRLDFYKYNWTLVKTGFFYSIPDLADFLYTLLISVQLFIYIRFDKKIKTASNKFLSASNDFRKSN